MATLQEIFQDNDDVRFLFPSNERYDAARAIANSRFDYRPAFIAYCKNARGLSYCLTNGNLPFRIRSGGHQHEGMCSANDIMLIDMSEMNKIEYLNRVSAWIPSGMHLKDVYKELLSRNLIIAGGGCGNVCVGGLVQGGGWGLSARKLGLSCDTIVRAEVVLANGQIVIADAHNEYKDLFWAIKGGGGGNFGVVTRFLFDLAPLQGSLCTFTVGWGKADMPNVVSLWANRAATFTKELTTFCRISVVAKDDPAKPSVLLGGQFFGTEKDLREILKPFFAIAPRPIRPFDCTEKKFPSATGLSWDNAFNVGSLLQSEVPGAPSETCDGFYPHKITSCFPASWEKPFYKDLITEIVRYINASPVFPNANTYISLHGMGGAIGNVMSGDSAFPYRDKDFMLQVQAWWAERRDPDAAAYMDWVETFRKRLSYFTEGSFINFPDVNWVDDHETPDGKLRLLRYYYGKNLDRLRLVKSKYDPRNRFSFEMSLPLL